MKLALILLLLQLAYCRKLKINDLKSDPLLILKVLDCKMQVGNIKIIHPINLTTIEKTINTLDIALLKIKHSSSFYPIISHKIIDLYYMLSQLKPKRYRRWDTIGTVWKWIAGSPDANDLRLINTTLNEIIDEHNDQFRVNEGINNRLTTLTQSMNVIIEQTHQNTNDSLDIIAMKLLINVNVINDVLSNLQDAIIGTKISLPSTKILTPSEMSIVTNTILQQGIKLDILEDALTLVEPKIAIKGDQILYIIQLPQISNVTAPILEIIPLPVQNQIIINSPKYLIQFENKLFTTTAPTATIQKTAYLSIFSDSCVTLLLKGTNSSCQTLFQPETNIQLITDDKILITNAKNDSISSDCGPDNRLISGNILLTIDNCNVTISNSTYEITTITQKSIIPGLFYNSLIQLQEINPINISKIDNTVLQNTKLLQHVQLKQYEHAKVIYLLFATLSLITIGLGIILTLYCKFKIVTNKTTNQPAPLTFQDLVQQMDDRGRPSLTPGGVTVTSQTRVSKLVSETLTPLPVHSDAKAAPL